MFYTDEEECCCGHDHEGNAEACDCGCCDEGSQGETVITMTDAETGEEFAFTLADDFVFEEEHYCVLVTLDDEHDPEMIITKVVVLDDGSEGLMSLDDTEYDRVYAEYERICEEDADEDEDSGEEK